MTFQYFTNPRVGYFKNQLPFEKGCTERQIELFKKGQEKLPEIEKDFW